VLATISKLSFLLFMTWFDIVWYASEKFIRKL
jgi:hypothetical protein